MTSRTVLVTSRSFSSGDLDARGRLEAAGHHVTSGPSSHDLETLRPLLAVAEAWIAGAGPVTAAHFEAAPRLRIVARYGVGVDSVDLAAAAGRDIVVTNTPGANSDAVADHAMALILASLRRVVPGDRQVRSGHWIAGPSRELGNLTTGIIGVGRVGRAVARRLAGFGGRILGVDPWVPDAELMRAGIEAVSLAELAERSDVVSLHAPGLGILIDAAWLARARPGLILVNTARAGLVDETAVARALTDGTIAAYASDVGLEDASAASSPLLSAGLADRTVFTPHTAAQTVEAIDRMSLRTMTAVLAVLRAETPADVVRPTPPS